MKIRAFPATLVGLAAVLAWSCTQISGVNDLKVLNADSDQTLTECNGQWNLCAAGQAPFCGNNGPFVCCDAEQATFCDIEGDGYGCWPAGTDCSSITQCGQDWVACAEGETGHCSADGEWACCGSDEPKYCAVDSAAPACWPANTDCSTIAKCGSDWLGCASGKSLDCSQGVCVK